MNQHSEENPAGEGSGAYAPGQRAAAARRTGRAASSDRRMSRGRRIWYAVIVVLIRGILRLFWSSCRIQTIQGEEHLDALRESGGPGIAAYWHQMNIMVSNYLLRRIAAGDRVGFLISPSVSGEVPAAVARRWGARLVRGSSSRTGGQALRDLHLALRKEQLLVALSPDGPKGPRHEFKSGAVLLSRMAGAPILPIAYAASPCTYWNSWDQFLVPWPFSRVAIVIGAPVQVPKGGGAEELLAWQTKLETIMAETSRAAEAALQK
jgi:lysophospholipid acyltransferase (LPLAT)-like uncharacterized protein